MAGTVVTTCELILSFPPSTLASSCTEEPSRKDSTQELTPVTRRQLTAPGTCTWLLPPAWARKGLRTLGWPCRSWVGWVTVLRRTCVAKPEHRLHVHRRGQPLQAHTMESDGRGREQPRLHASIVCAHVRHTRSSAREGGGTSATTSARTRTSRATSPPPWRASCRGRSLDGGAL